MSAPVEFRVERGDILKFEADVVAFKYAQHFYGADRAASTALLQAKAVTSTELLVKPGQRCFVNSQGVLGAREALFIGVESLERLGYESVRSFGASVIEAIAARQAPAQSLAMTIHGPGFGLDEVEAFLAIYKGCSEALDRLDKHSVNSVVFVDRDEKRVQRLSSALDEAIRLRSKVAAAIAVGEPMATLDSQHEPEAQRVDAPGLPRPGYEDKPRVFVAMPFSDDWEDVFHLGIYEVARSCGFVCERMDHVAFTGEILAQVKKRIESADLVVAELSEENGNVYLEVGYAWGIGRPTVLLLRGDAEPKFDVSGHKFLRYRQIKQLREILENEFRGLHQSGEILPTQAAQSASLPGALP